MRDNQGEARSVAMDACEIIENNKRTKIDTVGTNKNLSTRVYPETHHVEREEAFMQEDHPELTVMTDDSDPSVISQNRCPARIIPTLGSSSLRTEEEAYCLQNGVKFHSESKEFYNQENYLHNKKKRTPLIPRAECSYGESNGAIKEKSLILESVGKDDSVEAGGEEEQAYAPSIKYNFDDPLMAIDYAREFKTSKENFTKGCKWSPDGSCLLVAANDSRLRLFNLPSPVLQGTFQSESWFTQEAEKYTIPAITVTERELVYDYCWYPLMRSDIPSTCCLVATCRDQPIHLWDAWDGHLICSYRSYNHLDEMVAAYSVGFNLDGSRIVAGFKKCLRTFHTHRPGRDFEQIEAKEHPGIISCTSFNPQLPTVFAAGSYLGSIGLYNLERNNLFCRIDGDIGGVTQVKFSSCGTKLFSGSRKNNEILCWDIRNPGTLLCGYKREVSTNQRIYFDLEPHFSSFLVSGDTGGRVLKWDLDEGWEAASGDEFTKEPSSSFVAHEDCTNGVSIHPYCPLLATSSGQRHFPEPVSGSDIDSSSDTEEPKTLFTSKKVLSENTVKLWWLGGS